MFKMCKKLLDTLGVKMLDSTLLYYLKKTIKALRIIKRASGEISFPVLIIFIRYDYSEFYYNKNNGNNNLILLNVVG